VAEILNVLMDNACRHGGGEVSVAIKKRDHWVAIEVADQGPGLGDDPERAFARGTTGGEGHGIGLALARALAHAEGGRLTVHAGPRPVFVLTLRAGA
jgi:signal transduction histidine kinase